VKRAQKRGKDMRKLKAVLSLLIEEKPIPSSYIDHPLRGDWKGFRDPPSNRRCGGCPNSVALRSSALPPC
jgi:Bacterial toxin of type II toxin-antitoxin system, YafQ